MNYLDFDNVITQPVSFYQGNYYDKTFHVTKDGVDYDWADIEDIIVQARITKQSSEPTLELKKKCWRHRYNHRVYDLAFNNVQNINPIK